MKPGFVRNSDVEFHVSLRRFNGEFDSPESVSWGSTKLYRLCNRRFHQIYINFREITFLNCAAISEDSQSISIFYLAYTVSISSLVRSSSHIANFFGLEKA